MVEAFWKEHLSEVHAQLQGRESVLVGGYGRCDFPRSSAKYCTYTLMESETKQILHSETVTRDMVSYCKFCMHMYACILCMNASMAYRCKCRYSTMEREALRRSLEYLATNVEITELVTDASTSIIAMMGKPCMYMFVIILLPEVPVFQ